MNNRITSCIVSLLLLLSPCFLKAGNDTSRVDYSSYIKEVVSQRLLHAANHTNEDPVIDLELEVDETGFIAQNFRKPVDKGMWKEEKLKEAAGWLKRFSDETDARCFLVTIAVYNFMDLQDYASQKYDYEYFRDYQRQKQSTETAAAAIKLDPVRLASNMKTLLKGAMDQYEEMNTTGSNKKIIIYFAISYYVPKIKVGETGGRLYHHHGLAFSSLVDQQRQNDIYNHVKGYRGGLNLAGTDNEQHRLEKELYVARTIQSIFQLYKYGVIDSTQEYDNSNYVRTLSYETGFVDATAPGKKKGRYSEEVTHAVEEYVSRVNKGYSRRGFKVLSIEDGNPLNDSIRNKANEAAGKENKDLVVIKTDTTGVILDLQIFSAGKSVGKPNLCQALFLKSDIENFCEHYKIDLDKRSAFDESRIIVYAAYRYWFNYVKCITEEQTFRREYSGKYAHLFLAGAIHDGVELLDIVGLANMAEDIIIYGRDKFIDIAVENTIWLMQIDLVIDDLNDQYKDIAAGEKIDWERFGRILPPVVTTFLPTKEQWQITWELTKMLVSYVGDNYNNGYAHGRIALFVVPMASGIKGVATMVKELRLRGMEVKATVQAEKTLADAVKLTREDGRIIAEDAEGNTKTLERSKNQVWEVWDGKIKTILDKLRPKIREELYADFLADYGANLGVLEQFERGELSIAIWEMFNAQPFIRRSESYLKEAESVLNKIRRAGNGFDETTLKDLVAGNDNIRQVKELDVEEMKQFFLAVKEEAVALKSADAEKDIAQLLKNITHLEDIGKVTVKEFTEALRIHINYGEVKLILRFTDGSFKNYIFRTDRVWIEMKALLGDPDFMKLFLSSTGPQYEFIGMHNYSVYIGDQLLYYPMTNSRIIGNIGGGDVYKGKISLRVPDLDDIRKNGKWTGVHRQLIKKRVTSFYAENMSEEVIEQLISAAYRKRRPYINSTEWDAVIQYKGKSIKIHGYDNKFGNIISAFLEEIN